MRPFAGKRHILHVETKKKPNEMQSAGETVFRDLRTEFGTPEGASRRGAIKNKSWKHIVFSSWLRMVMGKVSVSGLCIAYTNATLVSDLPGPCGQTPHAFCSDGFSPPLAPTGANSPPSQHHHGRVSRRLTQSHANLTGVLHEVASLFYVDGIVKSELVEEVRQRLSRICIDTVQDINVLKEYIQDAPYTLFPTTEETERPDRLVAALMQGRIGMMVNGSPICLVAPVTFPNFLQYSEDYYLHWALALPLRLLRHLMFWTSILLPSLYVSALTYNQDLVQTPLLVSVAAQHLGIPWPTVLEALLMIGAFEALREAGTRLPRRVGQYRVSIVGTLIIGEASVKAGLISAGMVIIIALTGVAPFTLPSTTVVQTVRILQFFFVFAASFFGLVGIVLLGIVLVGHMVSLRSFGVPYMSPMAPLMVSDLKDVIIRAPWWLMW